MLWVLMIFFHHPQNPLYHLKSHIKQGSLTVTVRILVIDAIFFISQLVPAGCHGVCSSGLCILNAVNQAGNDAAFSIGQSLRIRVGPL